MQTEHISEKVRGLIQIMQDNEATDTLIYAALARRSKDENKAVLERITEDERAHRDYWVAFTHRESKVNKYKVMFYSALSIVLGPTFVVNMLEKAENSAQEIYTEIGTEVPEALRFIEDEHRHESELGNMIIEERLRYIGSMILGLNDALVELTGALAGFTLALANTRTVGLAGLITGIAATLSMAASEYLSKKADPNEPHPLRACIYTGIAYMLTVTVLLTPYFIFSNPYIALVGCLFGAGAVIFAFTGFVSVVRKEPFRPAFIEMISISFGVALISFLIGWAANHYLGM